MEYTLHPSREQQCVLKDAHHGIGLCLKNYFNYSCLLRQSLHPLLEETGTARGSSASQPPSLISQEIPTPFRAVPAAFWHRCLITWATGASRAASNSPKWLFSCVCSDVLPQVTVRCEVFAAAFWFTVKCFPCVKPLMCFQPKKHVKKIHLRTGRIRQIWPEASKAFFQMCRTESKTEYSDRR